MYFFGQKNGPKPKTICKHPKYVTEIEKTQIFVFFQIFMLGGKKFELEPITMQRAGQHGFFSSLGIFWHNL